MRRFLIVSSLLLLAFSLFIPTFVPAQAADIRAGEKLILTSSDQLTNAYVFGETVTSSASVSGDLITVGGNVTVKGTTEGSVMGGAGDMIIEGVVGNSVRVAGGNITIKGVVTHDVVVAGGTVVVDPSASIGGDLIFAGGTLQVNGPVKGRILMKGGSAIIASTVGGSVEGEVGTLQIKEGAEIHGDLNYTSSQKALIDDGAIVHGQETYHASSKKDGNQGLGGALAKGVILKLITDILFCLALIYLFPGILMRIAKVSREKPFKSGFIGLVSLFLIPFVATVLLLVLWLGVSMWLLYFLGLILAFMISKILLGWFVLDWWNKRNKKSYTLDWRAGILGPILLGILLFIPVIGWVVAAVIFTIAFGGLILLIPDLRRVKP